MEAMSCSIWDRLKQLQTQYAGMHGSWPHLTRPVAGSIRAMHSVSHTLAHISPSIHSSCRQAAEELTTCECAAAVAKHSSLRRQYSSARPAGRGHSRPCSSLSAKDCNTGALPCRARLMVWKLQQLTRPRALRKVQELLG